MASTNRKPTRVLLKEFEERNDQAFTALQSSVGKVETQGYFYIASSIFFLIIIIIFGFLAFSRINQIFQSVKELKRKQAEDNKTIAVSVSAIDRTVANLSNVIGNSKQGTHITSNIVGGDAKNDGILSE